MIFHSVNLLNCDIKLDGLCALVAAGEGFLVLLWILRGVLISLLFKDFTLFRQVSRAIQQACIFRTGRSITRMDCIVSLALASAALLRFGWRGGCSSLFLPAKNWHGQLLTVDYFWKVLLLHRSTPRFQFAQTYCMYPCRTFL